MGSLQNLKTLIPPNGRKTTEGTKELRRTIQLSSGKRVVEVIAIKKVFTFSYNIITGPQLETWLNFVGSDTWEVEIERRNGTFDKYSVRFSDETNFTYINTVGNWHYEKVSFVLEEI